MLVCHKHKDCIVLFQEEPCPICNEKRIRIEPLINHEPEITTEYVANRQRRLGRVYQVFDGVDFRDQEQEEYEDAYTEQG